MTQSTVYDWIRAVNRSKVQNERIHEFLSEMLGFTGAHLPQMLSDLRKRYLLKRDACRRFFTDVPPGLKSSDLFKRYVWSDLLLRENDYNRKLLKIARDYRQYLDGCIELQVQIMEYRSSWILQDFPAIQSKTMHCLPAHVVCDFLMAKYDFEHDEGKSGHIKSAEEEQKHLYQSIGNFRKQPVKTLWKLFEIYTAKSQDQAISGEPGVPRPIIPKKLADQPIIEVQERHQPISPEYLANHPIAEDLEGHRQINPQNVACQPVIEAPEVSQQINNHHLATKPERKCTPVPEPISSPDLEGQQPLEAIKAEQQVFQPIAELGCRDPELYHGGPSASPPTTSTTSSLPHGTWDLGLVGRPEGFQRPRTPYLGVPVAIKRKLIYRDGLGKRSNAANLEIPVVVKRKHCAEGETSNDHNPCKKPRAESYWPVEEATKRECHLGEVHVKESEYTYTRVYGLDGDLHEVNAVARIPTVPGKAAEYDASDREVKNTLHASQQSARDTTYFTQEIQTAEHNVPGKDNMVSRGQTSVNGIVPSDINASIATGQIDEQASDADQCCQPGTSSLEEECGAYVFASNANTGRQSVYVDAGGKDDRLYWGSQEKAQEMDSFYWGCQEKAHEAESCYWGIQETAQETDSFYCGEQEKAHEVNIFYWGSQDKAEDRVLDNSIDPAMGTELIDNEAADAEVEMFCNGGQHVSYDLQTLYSDEGMDMSEWGCTLEPTKFTTNPGPNARYVPARRLCVQ